jgi:hypothetical protein
MSGGLLNYKLDESRLHGLVKLLNNLFVWVECGASGCDRSIVAERRGVRAVAAAIVPHHKVLPTFLNAAPVTESNPVLLHHAAGHDVPLVGDAKLASLSLHRFGLWTALSRGPVKDSASVDMVEWTIWIASGVHLELRDYLELVRICSTLRHDTSDPEDVTGSR